MLEETRPSGVEMNAPCKQRVCPRAWTLLESLRHQHLAKSKRCSSSCQGLEVDDDRHDILPSRFRDRDRHAAAGRLAPWSAATVKRSASCGSHSLDDIATPRVPAIGALPQSGSGRGDERRTVDHLHQAPQRVGVRHDQDGASLLDLLANAVLPEGQRCAQRGDARRGGGGRASTRTTASAPRTGGRGETGAATR